MGWLCADEDAPDEEEARGRKAGGAEGDGDDEEAGMMMQVDEEEVVAAGQGKEQQLPSDKRLVSASPDTQVGRPCMHGTARVSRACNTHVDDGACVCLVSS